MSQNTTDEFDLPLELYAKPLALVGLSGLDTINNAVHKAIWETFNNNRKIERCSISFKLIDNAHEFPVVKPKRNSYEWYIPKGILKKNWINKYLHEIPAVMVIFYDLDWNDSQWNEKMIECASRVQSMRAALEGRNTRIVICLIQNSPPLPAGEDLLAAERANALCNICELTVKSLFVLPHDDHLQGYAVRLENAFYDLAQAYYHSEIKHVKSHKEHLNKTNHLYLMVRHQFKMAFLNELKQDENTAHKHYTHAYNHLHEIRIVDTNATEIRTVAGYINYKLCRLMFSINTPRDAISQFRAHAERFKQRLGFKELAFEHYAWLSKQQSIFGDIFDEAVKLGLSAVQTQHPGMYYYQAAQYMIIRKKLSEELCSNADTYPQPDPLSDVNSIEFYGQRPWRRGKDPDLQLENNGIQALRCREKHFNHSVAITTLYGMAIAQYKTYKCPRMRRHLVVQMADEYYNSQDYGKALTLLSHMLSDYRNERWWYIIAHILEKALKCAYLTASVQDYICICLEVLGENIPVSVTYKKRVYENLLRLLNKQIPESEPNVIPLKETNALWRKVVINEAFNVSLDLKNIISCIDCKARFCKLKYEADEAITLELFLRLTSPFPLSVFNISAILSTPGGIVQFQVKELENNSIIFKPNDIKKFHIEFTPDPNDVEKEIQIDSINLIIGKSNDLNLSVKQSGLGNDVNSACPEFLHFKLCKSLDFENIMPQLVTKLVPYNSKLNVKFEHSQPALLGEWYKVVINIINEEIFNMRDIKFELTLSDDVGIENTEFSLNPVTQLDKLPLKLNLSDLSAKSNQTVTFYVKSNSIGERNLYIKFSFTMEREKSIASVKMETLKLSIIKPFEVTNNFFSMMFENITKFYVGENLILSPTINCLSPQPIIIESTVLDFDKQVDIVESSKSKKQIENNVLQNSEAVSEIFTINFKKQSQQNVFIGHYNIKWKRPKGDSIVSRTPITGYAVDWIPIDIRLLLPAYGFVRTPVVIKYYLYNRSQQLVQLDVSMEASDGFMYAGYKQFQISILPDNTKELEYNLYPLIAGSVALPKLVLTVPEDSTEGPALRQEQINDLIERSLPTHFFVMPQTKGKPSPTHAGQLLNETLVK